MSSFLSYDVFGDGPGLVMIHGTSSSGLANWEPVATALAADHTVVLPDLPRRVQFAAAAHSRELAAGIRDARLAEVDGGYAAVYENADQVARLLREFVGDKYRPWAKAETVSA